MLERFTDRVYALPFEEGITKPALGLIVGDECSLVVDGGHSMSHGEEFLEEVHKLDKTNIKYLTVTHWHWDHVAGAETMNLINIINHRTEEKLKKVLDLIEEDLDVERLGNVMYSTASHLKEELESGAKLLKPDIVFEEKVKLDLGRISCIIENIGGDHSPDSNLIYVEGEKFMFLGDSIYRDLDKKYKCYHIDIVKPLVEKIMKYDTDYYLTAHKPVYNKKDMHSHFESLIEIGEFVKDRTDLKQITIDYGEKKGRKTTAEERFLIGSFVNGNKNKGK